MVWGMAEWSGTPHQKDRDQEYKRRGGMHVSHQSNKTTTIIRPSIQVTNLLFTAQKAIQAFSKVLSHLNFQ